MSFRSPQEDRWLEDHVAGDVHDFGTIAVEEWRDGDDGDGAQLSPRPPRLRRVLTA